MTLQVLVTTMHATDFSLIEKMNLRNTDVVIANQTDYCAYEEQNFPERNVHAIMISTNTTGLGLNRNIGISYISSDLLMFADDDMRFIDGFSDLIFQSFFDHPEAEAIKFYCESTNKERPLAFDRPDRFKKAKVFQMMSAGVPAMVIKSNKLKKLDLFFPTSIGAGRIYACGEDTIFYRKLLKAGIKLYISPEQLATVEQTSSSWFCGYHSQYFITVGYVYAKNYGKFAWLFLLRHAWKIKQRENCVLKIFEILKLMQEGILQYNR